ncbi:MAG TPA: ATP-binding protein, partial [Actinomycetota bacterium]|nr:ATP-binding protein [Actinomycetota bacterium]
GLYVSDEQVDALLAGATHPPLDLVDPVTVELQERVENEADRAEAAGTPSRLRTLARRFDLDGADVELLLIALAPEIEPRFERLYAYLQDDVTRRHAGPALALELCFGPSGPIAERWRLGEHGPLVAGGLLRLGDAERPFLTRSVTARGRVVRHLLGDDSLDPAIGRGVVATGSLGARPPEALLHALRSGKRLLYVRDAPGGAGSAVAAAAFEAAGWPPLVVDLARLGAVDDPGALSLEARLAGRALVAGPVEVLRQNAGLLRALVESRVPLALVGRAPWDPAWARETPAVADATALSAEDRAAAWRAAAPGVDAAEATAHFRLGPYEIAAAGRVAAERAALERRAVEAGDLAFGARMQGSPALERLARRVEPRARWDDLVVPARVARRLRDLADRARHRDRVLAEWGVGGSAGGGRGVVALFAGRSGTGKTMSAEIVAGDLGLDLYVVDLASVVDKYVGETEKNLDRIFDEADRVDAVLLFDEADALFGKRSGVEDAHDRYANIEVAYLLQRMEAFEGVAILTTNLKNNLDAAFARRLDAVVELPMPDERDRLRLWDAHLPPAVPRAGDVDLEFLTRFKLSGGNVRNACLAAAYRAAAADRAVTMEDLVDGVAQEYAKLGHMCVEAEFGPYYDLVRND